MRGREKDEIDMDRRKKKLGRNKDRKNIMKERVRDEIGTDIYT